MRISDPRLAPYVEQADQLQRSLYPRAVELVAFALAPDDRRKLTAALIATLAYSREDPMPKALEAELYSFGEDLIAAAMEKVLELGLASIPDAPSPIQ